MNCKFKIGQKVKLKSYEELKKSYILSAALAKDFADKVYKIDDYGGHLINNKPVYIINNFYFEEDSLKSFEEKDKNGNYLFDFT